MRKELGVVVLKASTGVRLNNTEVELLSQAALDLLATVDAVKQTLALPETPEQKIERINQLVNHGQSKHKS